MHFFSKSSSSAANPVTKVHSPSSENDDDKKSQAVHKEALPTRRSGWKLSSAGDGDTAMALFNTPDEVHEAIDLGELRHLERKIDFMILPYLAVSVMGLGSLI